MDIKAFLHVDGYKGYDGLPNVQLSGCWAHARRKFDEATKAGNFGKSNGPTLSEQGLAYINQLYKIERSLKGKPLDDIHENRQEKSVPVVDAFFAWTKKHVNTVAPKSLLGQAMKYVINQEQKLRRPFGNAQLDIDNNRVNVALNHL